MTIVLSDQATSADRHGSFWQGSRRAGRLVVAGCALLVLLALLFGLNMRRGLNHDEHQFVGSAVLMARDGLLPYADFAYFHVPGQTLLNAALFVVFDHFLLAARTLAVFHGWLGLALIFVSGLRFAPFIGGWARLGYALTGVVTLLASPIFVFTSGRAWNHDLPMLLTLAAVLTFLHVSGWSRREAEGQPPACPACWLAATGILLGLAAATRLSYAFLAPPFFLALWLARKRTWNARLVESGWLALGGLAGLAPVWWALLLAPDGFFFGNVVYNLRLNPLYYAHTGGAAAVTLPAKFAALGDLVWRQPANLAPPLLFVGALLPVLPQLRRPAAFSLRLVLLLLPFALFGALSATPSQTQYFYMLYPFFTLGFFYAVALWPRHQRWAALALAAGALVGVIATATAYAGGVEVLFRPDRWYPNKVHDRGVRIAELAGAGHVLTLAPIHALEGGLSTYPTFITGPLAWRVAPLVTAVERQRFGLVTASELAAMLKTQPPRAVLTGFEEDDAELEAVLLDYAHDHDFVPVALPDEGVLWLAPLTNWNGAIQLGAVELAEAVVAPGADALITLHLMNSAPIAQNLNVLVRVVDAAGREAARSEGWPYGSPTSTWRRGVAWPDGHTLRLASNAAPGPHRIEVSFYDPETLELFGQVFTAGYLMVADEASPPAAASLATFAHGLDLLSVDLGAQPWRPAVQRLTLAWRPTAPLPTGYTLFVHLLDPAGNLIAQHDQPPLQGFYPSDRWLPGAAFQDTVTLTLPVDAPTGDYRLIVGWYDPVSGQRLARRAPEAGDGFAISVRVEAAQ
ncbi:MAG TPA: hypothetical protein GYA08_10380 [Chloroflexi bacterium]|nr:hypothetical protein [Chloroflexota bacterium]